MLLMLLAVGGGLGPAMLGHLLLLRSCSQVSQRDDVASKLWQGWGGAPPRKKEKRTDY